MPSPTTNDELLDLVRKSGVLDEKRLDAYLAKVGSGNAIPQEPAKFAGVLVADGILTHFQAEQFLQGKWRRFTIGRYKVLERLGAGGMGSVYLCEHKLMRRRVAVKVLPTAKADDPASLERFYREARAVAALDHPNIVRAYDIDQDEKLHFLVMEFVDGANFQELVKRSGPLDVTRAAHYIRQAALGIQHAHEAAGLVHRDIKPGNILVDRNGIVKILDMGLARFFHDTDDILTKKYDENVLGTADYLAPEQALDSHGVDIRADIYSLGATFYFILTGRPPFAEGSVAQKLIWHQTRQPKAVRSIRQDVPEEMAAVLEKMMAKDPAARYQTPVAVAEALAPWTTTPIPPPPESEMPQLSPAAMGGPPGGGDPSLVGAGRTLSGDPPSGTLRKPWQVANGKSSGTLPAPAPAAPTPPPPPPPANLRKSGPLPPQAKAPPVLSPVPLRPTPAPVRPAVVAPAPAGAAPPEEEESAAWDKLVSDTEDPAAQLDTAPRSGAKSGKKSGGSPKGMSGGGQAATPESRRRLWIVVGVVSAAVVLLLAVGVWAAIALSSGPKDNGSATRPPLRVDPNGGPNVYKSIQEAVKKAGPDDHIVLMADVTEPSVQVSRKENLVIESAPGRKAVWRCSDKVAERRLLLVENSSGFELKDVVLDGAGQADALVVLFGGCPGLKLTGLDLKNFKQFGVHAISCDGAEGRPVVLTKLHIATGDPAQAGLYFSFTPSTVQKTQYFTVQDCSFDGPGHPVAAADPKLVQLTDGRQVDPLAAPPKP